MIWLNYCSGVEYVLGGLLNNTRYERTCLHKVECPKFLDITAKCVTQEMINGLFFGAVQLQG